MLNLNCMEKDSCDYKSDRFRRYPKLILLIALGIWEMDDPVSSIRGAFLFILH